MRRARLKRRAFLFSKARWPPEGGRYRSTFQDGVGFDFDEDFGRDEFADFDHGSGGADVLEKFTVGTADLLPLGNVGDEDPRANDIFQTGASTGERSFDIANDLDGLSVRIADADDFAVGASGGGAGDADVVAKAHGTGITDDGFPGSAGGEVLAWHIGPLKVAFYCVFHLRVKLKTSMP